MRPRLCLLLFLIVSPSVLRAQVSLGISADLDTLSVGKYKFTGIGVDQVYLQMNYASPKIINPGSATVLKGKRIDRIDLVYTNYPEDKDLSELNGRRIAALFMLSPELFSDPETEWRLVRQTDCHTVEQAYSMFHGFAITYASEPRLSDLLAEEGIDPDDALTEMMLGETPPEETTFRRILSRNKRWRDFVIVADLTGSMTPYVGEILYWLKLNQEKRPTRYFVFFNDGDGRPNEDKISGRVGGLHAIESDSLLQVLKLAQRTMDLGTGGDIEENNIEATLYAIERFPKAQEVLLVSDNVADPRDMELLEKIDRPLRVILCGANTSVNPIYLDVARRTGGSVHTIEHDITDLAGKKEGDVIQIGKERFLIKEGQFEKVSDL